MMLLAGLPLQAQEHPETEPAREPVADTLAALTRTQEMVEAYGLTPEQEAQVFELNLRYAGRIDFGPAPTPDMKPGQEEAAGQGRRRERPDFQNMSEAERQAFFEKREQRRAERQAKVEQQEADRKEYETALKDILDKKQFKAYRKDERKRRESLQEQQQGPGGRTGPGGPGGHGAGGPGGFRGQGGFIGGGIGF